MEEQPGVLRHRLLLGKSEADFDLAARIDAIAAAHQSTPLG
ncbi:hypothetical protein ACFTXM_05850 [Streptomyces sp. NPDC056930]